MTTPTEKALLDALEEYTLRIFADLPRSNGVMARMAMAARETQERVRTFVGRLPDGAP